MAAEVRLLLKMQEEILAQTRQLAGSRSQASPLTDEQMTALNQLRDRQKRLAQTARSIISRQNRSDSSAGSTKEAQP